MSRSWSKSRRKTLVYIMLTVKTIQIEVTPLTMEDLVRIPLRITKNLRVNLDHHKLNSKQNKSTTIRKIMKMLLQMIAIN
jgi:hypothetical protein